MPLECTLALQHRRHFRLAEHRGQHKHLHIQKLHQWDQVIITFIYSTHFFSLNGLFEKKSINVRRFVACVTVL